MFSITAPMQAHYSHCLYASSF
uniref:Uncharacterized protein n=1 Tax=Rhizophora mucronata TaxID=61149 RepID=A0A2P2QGF9_RHIMU